MNPLILMKTVTPTSGTDESLEPKWGKGVCISLGFHVLLFCLILFVPDSFSTRRMSGPTVYEVNLVELPGKTGPSPKAVTSSEKGKKIESQRKAEPTRRIRRPAKKEKKPVVISKRVVETQKKRKPKVQKPEPKVSPSKLIDDAVSKIEKRVETQDHKQDHKHVEQALSKIQNRVADQGTGGGGTGGADAGIAMRMYQMEVEQRIKGNWSCPVALLNPKRMQDLEAVVLVKVKQDGSILKSWLERKSSDGVFDRSVLRAVERSDPLPPFPEGYKRSFDEIEIRFNLSEMEPYY